jgi:predicted nuclease of predicted toxin-antitoxin system
MLAFKLDENLGIRGAKCLADYGHNVSTVCEQFLEGTLDDALIEICRIEKRCLVTLDLDFSNPIHYPPKRYQGIVVLRPPKNPEHKDIMTCLEILGEALKTVKTMEGKLWIASPLQIREYAPLRD